MEKRMTDPVKKLAAEYADRNAGPFRESLQSAYLTGYHAGYDEAVRIDIEMRLERK